MSAGTEWQRASPGQCHARLEMRIQNHRLSMTAQWPTITWACKAAVLDGHRVLDAVAIKIRQRTWEFGPHAADMHRAAVVTGLALPHMSLHDDLLAATGSGAAASAGEMTQQAVRTRQPIFFIMITGFRPSGLFEFLKHAS